MFMRTQFKWRVSMSRHSNGQSAQDPFFERMLDERIATLRAFLLMTSEKYDVPTKENDCPEEIVEDAIDTTAYSNVVPLRRAR